MKRRLNIRIVFNKRDNYSVGRGVVECLAEKPACLVVLAECLICCGGLKPDMQRDQCIVHRLADGKLPLAAADDLRVCALGEKHLIFDHLRHGLTRRENAYRREPVRGKNLRYALCFAEQRVIVGACCVKNVEPRGVMLPQKLLAALLECISHFNICAQRQPPCEEITAERHVFLPVALYPGICAFKLDVSIGKEPLRKGCLGAHDLFGALTVSVGYLVVMRHALVHIGKLTLHFSRRAMEHHKHRRRAEGPAAAFVYADRNARHLRAGAAVQAAHCAYVVVA